MDRRYKIGCIFIIITQCWSACDNPSPVVKTKKDSSAISVESKINNYNLTDEDIHYLDLMIPKYAMVEIYYKQNLADSSYIGSLKKYLNTKHTIITVIETKNYPYEAKPNGRLYIHYTGDDRYVLYIFK